jgi:Fe-S-cluster containining protein
VRLIDESDDQVPMEFTERTQDLYVRMRQASNGWCAALNPHTMLCTIYEKRPFLCREYAVGDYDCLNERKKLTDFAG